MDTHLPRRRLRHRSVRLDIDVRPVSVKGLVSSRTLGACLKHGIPLFIRMFPGSDEITFGFDGGAELTIRLPVDGMSSGQGLADRHP